MISKMDVIAIFDIGKTNKKLLLFNKEYKLVYEDSVQLAEITDEDGFPCEDVEALTDWIVQTFRNILRDARWQVLGVNFSGYGATMVFLGADRKVNAPLYNYLKPFSPELRKQFYDKYGGELSFSQDTASPVLGNLNSGMQLYRLKYERPGLFGKIRHALHLPQYLSFILTNTLCSDMTSIGCHTNLWDFRYGRYHAWVHEEGVEEKLAPIRSCNEIGGHWHGGIPIGIGLHDSSAALIPYLVSFREPFLLLSTGTWCISLNPFNQTQLTEEELKQDCLCYISYEGKPVKAARLFAGYEHEKFTKELAARFEKPADYFRQVAYSSALVKKFSSLVSVEMGQADTSMVQPSGFGSRDLAEFSSYEEAYHQLMIDIIGQQVHSTNLVLTGTNVRKIFVDGGFSNNPLYMQLLADAFPGMEVYAASVPQASALGAALVFHSHWNNIPVPTDLVGMRRVEKTVE